MIVYIVQFCSSDYECSYENNIKGFFDEKKAIEFMEDLELKNMILKDELKELRTENHIEAGRIRTMNIDHKEVIKKTVELSVRYSVKRAKLIEDSGLTDEFVLGENDSFSIDSIIVE